MEDRRDRDRDRDDRRRERSRDRDRERRRSRSRSRDRRRSRSRDRRRSRSRSPAYDAEKARRRPTWFDIPPIGGAPPPLTQLPGAVQVFNMPRDASGMAAAAGGPAAAPVMAAGAAMSQQATRHARRIYVGGLPPSADENNIATFFSNALAAVGGTTAGPGMCVVNVYVNYEKKFAFVEMRTVEEASNAMALDGIMFEGAQVRIRRPADYNAAAAAPLGPSMPNPNLNLAAIGLDKQPVPLPTTNLMSQMVGPGMTAQPQLSERDAAERIFVGGLPYYLTEEQCRELLGSFGAIKSFDLIKDRETQQSKGYGFVVYEDPRVTDVACAGLNGMQMGDRSLTVRRAQEGQRMKEEEKRQQLAAALPGAPPVAPVYAGTAARVVKLSHAVTLEELQDDQEYADILEDMREECAKYGTVVQVHIPRPAPADAQPPPGLGKVIIEFTDAPGAIGARNAMHGRKFGGRVVEAVLMGEHDYKEFKWD